MKVIGFICICSTLLSAHLAGQTNPLFFLSEPLVPVAAPPGGSSFTQAVNDTSFAPGSSVDGNSSRLATTFDGPPDRISGPVDPAKLVELTGHVTPLASPKFDQGPVESSRAMHITVLFLPSASQQQALTKLLAEQQDSTSPNFHKWLTPQQFGERFGLGQGDLDKISAWLTAAGFKVTYIANGRDFLSFEGIASQVESVFKTEIHNFSVKGKMHFANTKAPMVPAALVGIIGGFRGLHDFTPRPMHEPVPEYTLISGGTHHFLAPGDIATIYDINPLYKLSPAINGAGQKIVIVGQSDVYLADLQYYRTAFGISDITGCTTNSSGVLQAGSCSSGNLQVIWPDGDPGVVSGDLGESDLDIEVVSAVARDAEIVFVTYPATAGGIDQSAGYAIDNDLAKVISYSYGVCEAFVTAPDITAQETIYRQAAIEGISFFAAAGDSASAECDGYNSGLEPAVLGQSVSYPASSPEITGVGGTEFDEGTGSYWGSTNGSDGGSATSPIPETAWNDTNIAGVGNTLSGTGGGPSNCESGKTTTTVDKFEFEICNAPPNGGFAKPPYQQLGVTPNDGARDVPDLSFSASNVNDPYIVCTPESEIVGSGSTSTCANGVNSALTFSLGHPSAFGGTSASTPLAAAMTLLLNQYTNSNGLGTINTQLYKLFAANTSGVFNDIHSGTNSTTGGSSNNIVTCTIGDPTFEPTALQCPSAGTFGYSVVGGHAYSEVTGLGSLDVYAFFQAWVGPEIIFGISATALSPTSVPAGSQATSTVSINPRTISSQSATYNFSCSGLPAGGSCSFNPTTVKGSGKTTLTIATLPDMAAGTTSVTVTGTSGGASESASVSLVVTATKESFTVTPQNSTYPVTAGKSATVTVALASTTGFITGSGADEQTIEPVVYTCTDKASESTCTAPSGPTTATSVNFTVTTTAPSASLQLPFHRGTYIVYAALLPGLLGIILTFGSRKRSLRAVRMLELIMVLGLATWVGSCGGGNSTGNSNTNSNPGTPEGSYSITINAATQGANPVKSTATFTLQVQ